MRVLAIDGGGIRGLIPALVLTELERRAGRRTFELFDLIAGTSTGGILACALCAPEPLPASELVKLYEEEGPEIFDRSLFQRIRSAEGLLDEKYDDAALDRALERFLGHKRLSETKPDLIVPAYDTALPGPYFFKTHARRGRRPRRRLPAVGGRPRHVRRADLLRAGRTGERALVVTAACSRPTRRCAALAEVLDHGAPRATWCCSRSAPGSARTGGVRRDQGLGPRQVGSADPRRGVRRRLGRRGLPARARARRASATGASRRSSRSRATTSTTPARTTSRELRGHAEELIRDRSADLDAVLGR